MRKSDLEILINKLRSDLDYLHKRLDGKQYETSFSYLENHYVKRSEHEGLIRRLNVELRAQNDAIENIVKVLEANGFDNICNKCGIRLPKEKGCC